MLPSLDIGEAFIVGEAINFPTFFRVRKRRIQTEDSALDFKSMAKHFQQTWKSGKNSQKHKNNF